MINLISISKLLIFFSLIYFLIVSLLISLLRAIGIEEISDIRVAVTVGSLLELLLIFLFTFGWRKIWRKVPFLNDFLFPDLNGTWDAKIVWNWNGQNGIKEGTVYIKQSFSKISVDLVTNESKSSTLMVKPFKAAESDQPSFYYMYKSESKAFDPENRKDHKGAAILQLSLDNRNIMEGNYFTDRETFGHYTFTRKI